MNEENRTNTLFAKLFVFSNIQKLFSTALDKEDCVSLYRCKKILTSNDFIYNSLTKNLSEINAVKAIYLCINFATLFFQFFYATWFMYLIFSLSGLKKLYKVIFTNPLLAITFYLSFYMRMLNETDTEKFNYIATKLNIPLHEEFKGRHALSTFIDNTCVYFTGEKTKGYKKVLIELINTLGYQNIISEKIENIGLVLERFYKNNEILEKVEYPAVYIKPFGVESEIKFKEDEIKFLEALKAKKKSLKRKSGRTRNLLLERKIKGQALCLNSCEKRAKTSLGCRCESECSKSAFFTGKSWCYVDPKKCKKGKYLDTFMGRHYDICDSEKTDSVCFTGTKYRLCETKTDSS